MDEVERFEQLIKSECRTAADEAFARENLAACKAPRYATLHLLITSAIGTQRQLRVFETEEGMLATIRLLPPHCQCIKRIDLATGFAF
jgi:hypothetical protein